MKIALVYPGSVREAAAGIAVRLIYSELARQACDFDLFFIGQSKYQDDAELSWFGKKHISEFDAWIVSLPDESLYLPLLAFMRRVGVRLRHHHRTPPEPLIIGGGLPLMANPNPMTEFFDAIAVGEIESLLPNVVRVLTARYTEKRDVLDALSILGSVLTPGSRQPAVRAYCDVVKPPDKLLTFGAPKLDVMLPLEITRGCRYRCPFCQLTRAFEPYREVDMSDISTYLDIVNKATTTSVQLIGPSALSHGNAQRIVEEVRDRDLGISLVSVRVDELLANDWLLPYLSGVVRLGIELPASDRGALGKGFSNRELKSLVTKVSKLRDVRFISLNFIIGLPSWIDDDVQRIAALVLELAAIPAASIEVSLSVFIPETFTRFEDEVMIKMEKARILWADIDRRLRHAVMFNPSVCPDMFYLYGIFSRGDAGLASVLVEAVERGMGWQDPLEDWLSLMDAVRFDWRRAVYTAEDKPWTSSVRWC